MAKRQQLDYNSDALTQQLKTSTGQGMGAFFSSPSPTSSPLLPKTAPKKKVRKHARVGARTDASTQAGQHTHTDTQTRAHVEATLGKAIRNKKYLSSFTFRFKGEELEQLDRVTEEIQANASQKISKNDIVRLSLKWLLSDYEQNLQASVLARVLTDE